MWNVSYKSISKSIPQSTAFVVVGGTGFQQCSFIRKLLWLSLCLVLAQCKASSDFVDLSLHPCIVLVAIRHSLLTIAKLASALFEHLSV